MNFRDVELLSAYLDGRLTRPEVTRLETRLSDDPDLRASLEDLRQTRALLRQLPQRRAPRNFRLTPKMAGIRPPEARAYPVFRLATALAAFLFVASVALNAVTPLAASHLAPAAGPAYGIGGGGGGSGGEAPEAAPQAAVPPASTEAAPVPFAAAMPTPSPEAMLSAPQATASAPQDANRAIGGGAGTEPANKAAPMVTSAAPARQPLVPLPWVIALGAVMLACAAGAWLLQRNAERRFRERWNRK